MYQDGLSGRQCYQVVQLTYDVLTDSKVIGHVTATNIATFGTPTKLFLFEIFVLC